MQFNTELSGDRGVGSDRDPRGWEEVEQHITLHCHYHEKDSALTWTAVWAILMFHYIWGATSHSKTVFANHTIWKGEPKRTRTAVPTERSSERDTFCARILSSVVDSFCSKGRPANPQERGLGEFDFAASLCKHTHTHTHIQRRAHARTHTHARTHAHTHTHAHACTQHTHTHTHTHTHVRKHTHTHTHTHIHTHTHRRAREEVNRNSVGKSTTINRKEIQTQQNVFTS